VNDPTSDPPKQMDIFLDVKDAPCFAPSLRETKPRLFIVHGTRQPTGESSREFAEQDILDAVLRRAAKLGW
jgi:hypothetical protein